MISAHRLEHAKKLFLIAYPVSLGQLSHVITNISDSIMLGKYDAVHLAASTFAFSVFIPFLIFCIGFSMGITPFVSQSYAEEDERALKRLGSNGVVLFSGLAIVSLAVVFSVTWFLDDMGQSPRIVPLAKKYYIYLCLSLFPVVASFVFKQFSEGFGLTKPSMIINIVSNVINIGLNYVLIFGKCGFQSMGIEGAGIATLISRCCILLFSIIYTYRHPVFNKYLWHNPFIEASWKRMKELIAVSFPISIQFTMEVSAFAFTAIMIGWLGEVALASHQIAIGIASMTYLIASGLGAASTVRVGHFIGKKEPLELKHTVAMSYYMVLLFMGGSAAVIFGFRHVIPLMYVGSDELEVIASASVLLMIASVFQLSDGIQVVAHGVLRGMKDVKLPTYYSIIALWLFGVPSGYFFGIYLKFGVQGFWIGFVIGLTFLSLLLGLRVKKKLLEYNQ